MFRTKARPMLDRAMVVEHDLFARQKRACRFPIRLAGPAGAPLNRKDRMIGGERHCVAFARAQLQHGLLAGREESLVAARMRIAVDKRREWVPY